MEAKQEKSRDFRSGFNMGYDKGMADAKELAVRNIADAVNILAYVKCLEFLDGRHGGDDPDVDPVWELANRLALLLPLRREGGDIDE